MKYRSCTDNVNTLHILCVWRYHICTSEEELFFSVSVNSFTSSSATCTEVVLYIHQTYWIYTMYMNMYICMYICMYLRMHTGLHVPKTRLHRETMETCSWWHFLSILQLCNITIDEGFCREELHRERVLYISQSIGMITRAQSTQVGMPANPILHNCGVIQLSYCPQANVSWHRTALVWLSWIWHILSAEMTQPACSTCA